MERTWFRRLAPPVDGGVRLICFPHAGGASSYYVPLARRLTASGVEVAGVQYPGRQDRRSEPGVGDIVELAGMVARALTAQEPDRPYAFFGHSMGALVAYETVRHLVRRGAPPPVRLFVSGRAAPGLGPTAADRHADEEELVAHVRELGGTAEAVFDDPDLRAMVMPALRSDYRALRTYAWAPGEPVKVPMTMLVGNADPVAPVDLVRSWSGHSALPARMEVFAGGHFFLDHALEEVAELVVADLDALLPARADRRGSAV
ncbi:thioesterase II family protein [Nocardiopsis sp. NPDC058631]|uniref:thioesterase II family protein n=1 Tax=Nocardiopsis sp. NPDC058631 TaxID=3346566 RepID=UPI00365A6FA9